MAKEQSPGLRGLKLVLASSSPRRKEILELAGCSFTIRVSGADEQVEGETDPQSFVQLVALRKADAVPPEENELVIAADTVVALGERILGKPQNREEAVEMLTALSGKTHKVFTGVCMRSKDMERSFVQMTEVELYPLSREEILDYVESGEPMDKAGAYGIQGRGCLLVRQITGDYYNAVGLPVARLVRCIEEFTAGV